MVVPETLEGIINHTLWFHYDVDGDVLYLRLASERNMPALGEETPEGFVLLRREDDDRPVGLTVVNWWKRFGKGALPDSLEELGRLIEPLGGRVAA
jgi:hypothetical protein